MTDKRIHAPGILDQETGRSLFVAARGCSLAAGDALIVDLAETEDIDSHGAAWLADIAQHARSKGAELRLEGQRGEVAEFLDMVAQGLVAEPEASRARTVPFFERVGGTALAVLDEARDGVNLIVDAVYWIALAPLEGRRFRWGLFVDEAYEMGVRAVKVNSLMCFLLGVTIAMLSAAQMQPLGLGIYVANIITVGFSRELAVLMTAVVVSARTGAAIAAELSTMKVQDEINALRGMGLNVPQFLVAPKVGALLVVLPCLTILGLLAGIAGGMLWGITVQGYEADLWLQQTLDAAAFRDLFQGLVKCFFFAIVIVLVGCHNGLRVEGGSRGVGLMTTRAVVMDIFFIIVIDMMCALVFYYLLDW